LSSVNKVFAVHLDRQVGLGLEVSIVDGCDFWLFEILELLGTPQLLFVVGYLESNVGNRGSA